MSQKYNKPDKEFSEKVVQVNRVSKKTKGGNQIGFSVLMVVGDRKGKVGVALGKAPDVLSSIKKGVRKAKKRMIRVPLTHGTIPFAIECKYGAAVVYLKPAPEGSGIIAGGAVRAVVEAAGVTDIVGKIMGSSNQANNVYATFKALQEIKRLVKVKDIKLTNKSNHANISRKPATAQTGSDKKSELITPKTKPATKGNRKEAKESKS